MGRTVQEKIEQAVRAAIFDEPPPEGRCTKIVLAELPRGADAVRIFGWPVPRDPRPDFVGEIAMQAAEFAQEHTDMFGENSRRLFCVECLFGPGEVKLLSSSPFAVRASSSETALAARNPDGTIIDVPGMHVGPGMDANDSALPPMPAYGQQRGLISGAGMITDLHRLLIASSAQTMGIQQQMIHEQREMLKDRDAEKLEMFGLLQELADRKQERQFAIDDRARKAEREEKAWEVFTPLFYLLANKFAGKPVLPSEHPAMLALKKVFAQMTPSMAEKLLAIFEPHQAAVLLDIYQTFAKEEEEKIKIEEEKAAKKAAEKGETAPNGQEAPDGTKQLTN